MGNGSDGKSERARSHVDPICGKLVVGDHGRQLASEYKKRKYFFCSDHCRRAFEQHTERFRVNELARVGALFNPMRVRWGMA
jgi:YHS domain-containing protein